MKGSFDWDILIGDSRPNAILGQPGADWFYGGGGDDVIDARDGTRDFSIQCGGGRPTLKFAAFMSNRRHRRWPRPHRPL